MRLPDPIAFPPLSHPILIFVWHSCVLSVVCIFTIKKTDCHERHTTPQKLRPVTDKKKSELLVDCKEKEEQMLNRTIVEGLEPYRVGEKIRTLRLRKSMGLVELGKHTGLSPAMLSKLERGKLFPTLPTLLRIALVFGVGLEYFFTDERKRHVVAIARKKERMRFPDSP